MSQKIIVAVGFFVLIGFIMPAMALPPEMEADRLLLSATLKLDSNDYEAAAQDLEKIRALKVTLPVEYYFQNGRYHAATRHATEAKKNLETYLDKAGKEGRSYYRALKLHSQVEADERRLARFKDNGDGTVTDVQTSLMWAAKDNGRDITWADARVYCVDYSGGGYTDWRMPTQAELAGLYDKEEPGPNHITPFVKLSKCCPWAIETRGSEATHFSFSDGYPFWGSQSGSLNDRVLPVRSGK
ncbi:MAG: DUF1566 domain-containing protein [Proteobacteria bacterium]|nr:DUF1566 domain-containing protein [Pseudomonadota bacterium]